MAASNGGISQPLNLFLIALTDFVTGKFFEFDVTDFNDTLQGSFYFWKVEDILAGRTPTCNRQIVTYRDLGEVDVVFTLSGYDPNSKTTVTETAARTLGTVAATGKLCTVLVDFALTAENLQFSVTRAADAGPLSIVKVRLEGEVERTAYS